MSVHLDRSAPAEITEAGGVVRNEAASRTSSTELVHSSLGRKPWNTPHQAKADASTPKGSPTRAPRSAALTALTSTTRSVARLAAPFR